MVDGLITALKALVRVGTMEYKLADDVEEHALKAVAGAEPVGETRLPVLVQPCTDSGRGIAGRCGQYDCNRQRHAPQDLAQLRDARRELQQSDTGWSGPNIPGEATFGSCKVPCTNVPRTP